MIVRTIDLNADVGEDAAALRDGREESLIRAVSSINIAAGGHAGDASTIERVIKLAAAHRIAVGAHPSYPDRKNFGRRSIDISAEELRTCLCKQIALVVSIAQRRSLPVMHIKPHGALYHDAATRPEIATSLARALRDTEINRLVVPPTLKTQTFFEDAGIALIYEGFADRAYTDTGKLVSRDQPAALIKEPDQAAAQALRLATSGLHDVTLDTLCIHSDTPNAIGLVRSIRGKLTSNGITIASPRT